MKMRAAISFVLVWLWSGVLREPQGSRATSGSGPAHLKSAMVRIAYHPHPHAAQVPSRPEETRIFLFFA